MYNNFLHSRTVCVHVVKIDPVLYSDIIAVGFIIALKYVEISIFTYCRHNVEVHVLIAEILFDCNE